jgi:hypothetical protein
VKITERDEDVLARYEQIIRAAGDSVANADAIIDMLGGDPPPTRAQVRRAQARKALAERFPAATVSRTQEWRLRKKMERRGGLSHPTRV